MFQYRMLAGYRTPCANLRLTVTHDSANRFHAQQPPHGSYKLQTQPESPVLGRLGPMAFGERLIIQDKLALTLTRRRRKSAISVYCTHETSTKGLPRLRARTMTHLDSHSRTTPSAPPHRSRRPGADLVGHLELAEGNHHVPVM